LETILLAEGGGEVFEDGRAGVSGFADRGAGRERHHCYFGGRHGGAFGGLCWCTGVLAVLVEVSVW
jgi:hypothetical protein